MNIRNHDFRSIDEMRNQFVKQAPKEKNGSEKLGGNLFTGKSFREVLISESAKEVGELRFSKHANQRLESRNIRLSAEQMARLSEGTDRARKKGINESLIVVDEFAFIVNVKNNMVVTAVGESEDKIFTNIDGAVIG